MHTALISKMKINLKYTYEANSEKVGEWAKSYISG